jgi:hypothetical protein
MSTHAKHARGGGAEEASRYLAVVDTFAALDADPHAAARARAARGRAREDRNPHSVTPRKAVFRWRS